MSGSTFTVLGQPVAWARAGKSGKRHFTQGPQAAAMNQIAWEARAAGVEMILGPVALSVVCISEPPKSWQKKTRRDAMGQFRPVRPDLSNFVKLIEDALNCVAYADDGQIVRHDLTDIYGPEGKTIICVRPAEIGDLPRIALAIQEECAR